MEYRPRSSGELRARLERWDYDEEEARRLIEHLTERGILDDRQFALQFTDELVAKGFGLRRVRSELVRKRLDRDLIDQALESYPHDEEYDRAREVAALRLARMARRGPDTEKKLVDYLLRRGFSALDARRAYRNLCDVDTEIWQ
ncbi:MAG: regulatory protein RecX [Actinomycetota bacterium]